MISRQRLMLAICVLALAGCPEKGASTVEPAPTTRPAPTEPAPVEPPAT